MDDLISRRAAIDAIEKKQMPIMRSEFLYDQAKFDGLSVALNIITELPSAEPEIIQCKDCKHFNRDIPCVEGHYNGCDAWTDNGNEIMVAEDDFCSYAERRAE